MSILHRSGSCGASLRLYTTRSSALSRNNSSPHDVCPQGRLSNQSQTMRSKGAVSALSRAAGAPTALTTNPACSSTPTPVLPRHGSPAARARKDIAMRQIPLLIFLAMWLAACGASDRTALAPPTPAAQPGCVDGMPAPTAQASGLPATPQPTSAPAPTVAPLSPAPTDPATAIAPTSVPYDLLAATAIAWATSVPFPTAAPAVVQPGQPAAARAVRGGLSLSVTLPSDRYLAGEAAPVGLTLRNDGTEPLFVAGDGRELGWLTLRDERGNDPDDWPWRPANWPGGGYLLPLAPGQTVSTTLTLQTPPEDMARGHAYTLWAATRVARAVPGTDGPDNLWLHLEAGPIALTLTAPAP